MRRHFWRYATFGEIGDLYMSRLLRMVALNIAASFISIYLYQEGYSVAFIAGFWAGFYFIKIAMAIPASILSAWIGPKHSILISNILFIPSMVAFALVPEYGQPMLGAVLIFQSLSAILYGIAYNVDFSKVKSDQHAGKELAYMHMIEKIAAGLSPLAGGALALWVGPQLVLIVTAALFLLSAIPLLRTAEVVKPRQRLTFKGFPWHLVRSMGWSQFAFGFDVFVSGTAWSLFTAIFIIGVANGDNEVYFVNGILMSVIFLAALISSYIYGKLIDRRKGRELMHISAVANSVSHLARLMIWSPFTTAGFNAVNELAKTGYILAHHRGVFDNADLSGRRTLYIGVVEAVANIGAGAAALALMIIMLVVGEGVSGFYGLFLMASAVALLILTARFPIYRR